LTGPLSGTLLAVCGLAFALGARHGLDADHLATIDGLARRSSWRHPGLARFAGTLFSLGHGVVVMAVAVAASVLAAQWHTPAWLELGGTLVSVVFLLGLAWLNLHAVWTTPRHEIVAPAGLKSRLFKRMVAVEHPLFIMGVGMLFALSFDTISQAALFAVAATRFGSVGHTLLVAGSFVLGMLVADGLNGLWIARLIRRADRRAAVASRVMASTVGLVSLAIGCFVALKLLLPGMETWAGGQGLLLGGAVIAAMGGAFVGAMLIASLSGAQSRPENTPAE
jgi:nickel/cobalt transporter (NiCoT) family protein